MQDLLHRLAACLQHQKVPVGVVLLDIDFFIRFCMRLTQKQTTELLAAVGTFLRHSFGEQVIFLHEGGDEFAAVLPGCDTAQTFAVVEKIRRQFRRERFFSCLPGTCGPLRLSFSAGIASCPCDAEVPDALIRKVVTALFMAKSRRRNQIFCFDSPSKQTSGKLQHGSRKLWDDTLLIRTILGREGEIGCVSSRVAACDALFWEPQALATDEHGRLYIADQNNHRVLVWYENMVRPVAGCGAYGFSGDGGPAAQARLNKPTGVWARNNKVYIADTGNDAIRVVELDTQTIHTLAGTGAAGWQGDGAAANRARLNKPGGVVCDNEGNVYIDDIANNVIRRVRISGRIDRFAGTGRFGFSGDGGPAVQADFNEIYGIGIDMMYNRLLLADYGNHRVRAVCLRTGVVSTLAGNGAAGYSGDGGDPLCAGLCRPVAVCADARGNVYIADSGNDAVRIVAADDHAIYTLAGGVGIGTGEDAELGPFQLANPNGLAASGRFVYILDGANNRICRMVVPPQRSHTG